MDAPDGQLIQPRKRVSQACVPCSKRKTKVERYPQVPLFMRVEALILRFSVTEASRLVDNVFIEESMTVYIRFQRGTKGKMPQSVA